MALLVVVTLLTILVVPAAEAGGGTAVNVALGLASFAVFTQLFGGLFFPPAVYAYPAYYPYSAAYYAQLWQRLLGRPVSE